MSRDDRAQSRISSADERQGAPGADRPGAALRIELFTDDLTALLAFYRDVLDFELVRDERDHADPYLALQRGSIRVGAAHRSEHVAPSARRPPAGVEIVLEVPDVVAERDRVADLWPLEEDLRRRPWGLTDFRVLDPAGHYLRLTGVGADAPDAPQPTHRGGRPTSS